MLVVFIIWMLCGATFVVFGIAAFYSKEAVGFWANSKIPEIQDVKGYNHAVGKLWLVAAFVFILLGQPLLIKEENDLFIVLSVVGVVFEMIVMMIVYSLKIESKYRKKHMG